MNNDDYKQKVEAVREITSLFRLERYVYVGIIIVCLIILIGSIVYSLIKGTIGTADIASMMTSGGAITIITGRLLHMWDKTLKLLEHSA